jgi:hypothetical protein
MDPNKRTSADQAADEASRESFPASDPPALGGTTGPDDPAATDPPARDE